MPASIFSTVERILQIDDNGLIYCDSVKKIQLVIGQETLTLGPEFYIDQTTKDSKGKCNHLIQTSVDAFYLPWSFMSTKCLALDFKIPQISLTDSIFI